MTTDIDVIISHALNKSGFGHCRPEVEAVLRNEVLLSPNDLKSDSLPIGSTKQGGEPDLSPGYDWPKYSCRGIPGLRNTSKPMTFLAQLRCADIKPFAPPQFPDRGLLSFFVAIEHNTLVCTKNEQPIGRVLYSPGFSVETQMRTPFPRGLYFDNRLPPGSLKIESSRGIGFDVLCEVIERHFGSSLEISGRIWDLYLQEIIPFGCHKLFGPPTMLELDVMEETRLLAQTDQWTRNNTSDDWLLLLEFDLVELPFDLLHNEIGRLYYIIHRDDLAACRFHRTSVLYDALEPKS